MRIRALLWDFGDTLADEAWMRAPMAGIDGWPAAWREQMGEGELARRWDLGEIGSRQVAEVLGARLGAPAERVLEHMRSCCAKIAFFPKVMEFVARCQLPQAIVTINPDLFTEVVAPHYRLAECFSPIVASWREGTRGKADLCDIALGRLGGGLRRGECLLIDNKAANVAEWRERGGAGYVFQTEAALLRDLTPSGEVHGRREAG